jgi:hypothetical protein
LAGAVGAFLQFQVSVQIDLRGFDLFVAERTRAIMLTFYVIETEGSVARDPMLAGAAWVSVRDTPPCPPP